MRGLIDVVKTNSLSKKVDTPSQNQGLLEEVVKDGWNIFDIFLEILKGYESHTLKHIYDKMITARDAGLGSLKQGLQHYVVQSRCTLPHTYHSLLP